MNTASLEDGEIQLNILDLIRTLVAGWKFIATIALVGAILGLALCFVIKPWYTAGASFMPPKDTDSLSPQPASILLGAADNTDSYLGMLNSRTVQDDVIDQLNLMAVYKAKLRVDARTQLSKKSKFTVTKNALVQVDVTADDPKLAADIANAYLEALYRLRGKMFDSSSDHRRVFFEKQLNDQKAALAQAESDLKSTQQQTGIVLPGSVAQAGLNATAQLQAQIGQGEARLAGLLASETEQNPQVVETRSELKQLEAQLLRQQSAPTGNGGKIGIATNGQLPELALENLRKEREVKLRELIYNSIVNQYEKARLSSVDPGPQLEIVDRAIAPERKSGPPRQLLVLGGATLGFIFGIVYLLAAGPVRRFVAAVRQPAPAQSR